MLIRSRSARFAALALAVTTPLVAANALPAFAAGESASAVLSSESTSTKFVWNYTFGGGTHDLSNIAIGFCSSDILADVASVEPDGDIFLTGDVAGQHGGFGPGIKFDRNASQTTGTLTVNFNHPHEISPTGLRIQSHSGDGNDPDVATTAAGPGPCEGDPTGNNTGGDNTGGNNTGGNNNGGGNNNNNNNNNNNGGGNDGGDDTSVQPTVITDDHQPVKTTETSSSDPAPKSEVLGVTLTDGNNPAPAAAPAASPAVGGNNAVAPAAELPHTGAGNIQFLMTLALSLLAAGVALRAAFGRRIRSASSPS